MTQLSKDHEQLIYVVLVRMEHLNQEMDSTAQARNSFLMLYLPLVSVPEAAVAGSKPCRSGGVSGLPQ